MGNPVARQLAKVGWRSNTAKALAPEMMSRTRAALLKCSPRRRPQRPPTARSTVKPQTLKAAPICGRKRKVHPLRATTALLILRPTTGFRSPNRPALRWCKTDARTSIGLTHNVPAVIFQQACGSGFEIPKR